MYGGPDGPLPFSLHCSSLTPDTTVDIDLDITTNTEDRRRSRCCPGSWGSNYISCAITYDSVKSV